MQSYTRFRRKIGNFNKRLNSLKFCILITQIYKTNNKLELVIFCFKSCLNHFYLFLVPLFIVKERHSEWCIIAKSNMTWTICCK